MNLCTNCGAEGLTVEQLPKYEHVVVGCRVLLVNAVNRITCPDCSHTIEIVPDQEGLIGAVATWRVMQPTRLSPRELRLLRKATNLKATEFAEKTKLSAESLSRWENGKDAMSAQSERFVRLHIGLILQERPHALDIDVTEVIEMDLKPFSPVPIVALPKFERVVSKDIARKTKKREWDSAMPEDKAAA